MSTNLTNLISQRLLTKTGVTSTSDHLRDKKRVAFYFSSGSCSHCRTFTPQLSQFYSIVNQLYPNKPLEIIFVSLDGSQREFNDYYNKMLWTAIPHDQSAHVLKLFNGYFNGSVPHVLICDVSTSNIIDNEAYEKLYSLFNTNKIQDVNEINNLLNIWFK